MTSKNISGKSSEQNETNESVAELETQGLSQGQIVRRKFWRHRAASIAVGVLGTLVVFVFTALDARYFGINVPGWWKFTHTDLPELNFDDCPFDSPGCPTLDAIPFIDGDGVTLGTHPFGQDDIGRDYFALVLRGTQRSLLIMVIIGIIAAAIGTVVGAVSGYFRGWIDAVLMRLTDFIITIPAIIIGSVIGYHFGNLGATFLAFYLGLFAWTGLSRLIRGEFLTLREREFVDAARVAGASDRRIIFKHILPNAIGVIIVSVTLLMSGAILLETGLSYLGFGVVAPDVSLGLLVSTYQESFTIRPWLFWWPGVFIVTIALCVNFIGDGLRDAFDPRQLHKMKKHAKDKNVTGASFE